LPDELAEAGSGFCCLSFNLTKAIGFVLITNPERCLLALNGCQWFNCCTATFFNLNQETTMNFTNDEMIATQKSNLEAFAGLSEKAFASFEKLVELNMAASKALMTESISNLQALAGAKDAQALLALQSEMLKPMAEKAASYSRHLYDIISGSSADFSKVVESTSAETQKTVTALLESSLKDAPAGSEAAVAVIKSAMTAGASAVETAQKSAKQAVEMIESNITSMTSAS
jgi:phasin family protein